VTWADSFLYEASGLKPALAAAGTAADFLEAHQAMEGVGPLWYRIGQLLKGNRVVWSDAGKYDSGMRPALTAPENYRFVEVHQAGFSVGPLWNRFATWDLLH
jgi:hypothetical protein